MAANHTYSLRNKRVVILRQLEDSKELAEGLSEFGAEVIYAPTLDIKEADDVTDFYNALRDINSFFGVAFTSRNGVRSFFNGYKKLGLDTGSLAGTHFFVVGSGTADELEGHGFVPSVIAKKSTAEGLVEAIINTIEPSVAKKVLCPLGNLARPNLVKGLREAGFLPVAVVAYKTVPSEHLDPQIIADIQNGFVDIITCTSSSTISFLFDLCDSKISADIHLVAIGPKTADTIGALGLVTARVADPHNIEGLIKACCEVFSDE